MIRLQDIADMAGVSRTTLSNVINGNAKRVSQAYGMYSLQDSFVGELVGTIQMEAEMKGYYVMLIGGENIQNVGVDDYSGGYQIGSYLCLTGIFTFDSIPGQLIGFRFHFGSKMFLIPSNDYSAFGCFCCRTV